MRKESTEGFFVRMFHSWTCRVLHILCSTSFHWPLLNGNVFFFRIHTLSSRISYANFPRLIRQFRRFFFLYTQSQYGSDVKINKFPTWKLQGKQKLTKNQSIDQLTYSLPWPNNCSFVFPLHFPMKKPKVAIELLRLIVTSLSNSSKRNAFFFDSLFCIQIETNQRKIKRNRKKRTDEVRLRLFAKQNAIPLYSWMWL